MNESSEMHFGRYQVVGLLGKGTSSTVYRATDPLLGREVAIKAIHPILGRQPGMIKRFEREAMALAKLDHPNIIRIFDMGQEGDVFYMVIRYLSGGTLKERMKTYHDRGTFMPFRESSTILSAICNAVDYIHRAGLIHRDLKPSNIMFDPNDRPILADFGIVKVTDSENLTMQGGILGTPFYMSPEQCLSEEIDCRSDIYSLGVILYEMCTGHRPFTGKVFYDIFNAHMTNQAPKPPEHFNPAISPPQSAIILRALARQPEDRFQNALEMSEAYAAMFPTQSRDTLRIDNEPTPKAAFLRSVSSGVRYRLQMDKDNRIGRSKPSVPIEIDLTAEEGHEYIHSWHATIRHSNLGWIFQTPSDVTNPVYVNNIRVQPGVQIRLSDGDQVSLGVAKFVLEINPVH
jgi:serine/threonine protein kinase